MSADLTEDVKEIRRRFTESLARAVDELPTTWTRGWLGGWESVSKEDVLSSIRRIETSMSDDSAPRVIDGEIPADAVRLAATRLCRDLIDGIHDAEDVVPCEGCMSDATAMLAAAISTIRRQVTEEIAKAIEAVDPVEWALAGQYAGRDAAALARQVVGGSGKGITTEKDVV